MPATPIVVAVARLMTLAFLLLALAEGARGALWVSPTGDDRNPGTEEQPLRTLERARDIIRGRNQAMDDDITVFLAGVFHLDGPFEIGPQDGATNGLSIIYTAAPGEHPVLSGGQAVEGWTLTEKGGSLWSAPAPQGLAGTPELFVNGRPARRTQGRLVQAFTKPSTEAAPTAPAESHWRNPSDVVFRPEEADALWTRRGEAPARVVNAFELLGAPGTWYFDRAARRIYYTPLEGEDMATAHIVVAAAHSLVTCTGSADHPVTGIIFKGIRFEYTAGNLGDGTAEAAVSCVHAGKIQFLEDAFVHLGTPGVRLGPDFADGNIEGCLFGDIAHTGLSMTSGRRIRVADCRFSYVADRDLGGAPLAVDRCEAIAVEHCQIDHFPCRAVIADPGTSGIVSSATNRIGEPLVRRPLADPVIAGSTAPDAGLSADYAALAAEPIMAPARADPPSCVSAEAEDESAYVSWLPPCLDGLQPVTGYRVSASDGHETRITAADFLARGYVLVDGLENGHPITFTVAALTAAGSGPPSLATPPISPAHKRKLRSPQVPRSVSLQILAGRALVRIVPGPNGGSPVTAYLLRVQGAQTDTLLEGRDVLESDESHPFERWVDGFAPPPGSQVAVAARNIYGDGQAARLSLEANSPVSSKGR